MTIAMLAAGIGGSAAMFTVVDSVLLRPPPYRSPGQLVEIMEAGKKGTTMLGAAYVDIQLWRERSRTLQSIAFHTWDKPTGDRRLASGLLQFFGGSALFLCVGGLYGLLACLVSQRTRELGVRLALGAQKRQLIWLVMRRATLVLFLGSAIGLALSLAGIRIVANLLYGVNSHDTWTLITTTVLLIASGLTAAYVPARKAANVNPMEALRAE